MRQLHAKTLGSGQALLILHGFLGMGDNWKTLGNQFAKNFEVHLIDQRNHGRSFHDKDFSYDLLAKDLHHYILANNLQNCIVLGHSMGGKTAMQFALEFPNLVAALIVADIAPKTYPAHHQYILKALAEVDFEKQRTRNDVAAVLKNYIDDMGVIQFLMKNVYRVEKNTLGFRFNLASLTNKYDEVVKNSINNGIFNKPTLFLKGSKSDYIMLEDDIMIKKIFLNSDIQEVSNSGHWLHAENPKEFYSYVIKFLIN
jgi:pimeloyl-ACP methyl ester carboxylesterase